MCCLIEFSGRTHQSCGILTEKQNPLVIMKKSDQFKIDILHNNWTEIFKFVKIMKVKERLKNCSTLKETNNMTTKCNDKDPK